MEYRELVRVHTGRHGQRLILPEEVETLNQQGLENLISHASKRTLLQFMKWYYEEALPSIPQTG